MQAMKFHGNLNRGPNKMHLYDTFSAYSPIINFIFYIGAIVCGMFFIHPAFLACAVFLSASYYLTIRGRKGLKTVFGIIPVWIAMSVINPLLNTRGDIILFTYFGDRPYTFEALCYGMALGAMFISVILWFMSYNAVMTSDKFIYLFGRIMPSVSLILTMVLRLVPNYSKKIRQIYGSRKCIGKGSDSESRRERAEDGLTVISALTSWAFEGGIITADSMRARGYGTGKRTNFSIYSFESRDRLLLAFMIIILAVICICSIKGGMAAAYTPEMMIAFNMWTIAGTAAYFIFLAIPTALNILETLTWHILRSKI